MGRGGARAGAGRPKKQGVARSKRLAGTKRPTTPAATEIQTRATEIQTQSAGTQTPLEFMLSALNDPKLDMKFRAQMAQAAAPFVHPKAGETPGGVKAARSAAAKTAAASARFRPVGPPILRTVSNRDD